MANCQICVGGTMVFDIRKLTSIRIADTGAAKCSIHWRIYLPMEFRKMKKKSGKWKVLADLKVIDKIIHPMGSLHPGIPFPYTLLHKSWLMILIYKITFYNPFA